MTMTAPEVTMSTGDRRMILAQQYLGQYAPNWDQMNWWNRLGARAGAVNAAGVPGDMGRALYVAGAGLAADFMIDPARVARLAGLTPLQRAAVEAAGDIGAAVTLNNDRGVVELRPDERIGTPTMILGAASAFAPDEISLGRLNGRIPNSMRTAGGGLDGSLIRAAISPATLNLVPKTLSAGWDTIRIMAMPVRGGTTEPTSVPPFQQPPQGSGAFPNYGSPN